VTRFAERTLQIAIQAMQARNGWLTEPELALVRRMIGLRNILVHGYEVVDPAVVRDLVATRLGDLTGFVAAIRRRLDRTA
jgi:uncharacterized protein YutE (UPF0331/DUF86 family)